MPSGLATVAFALAPLGSETIGPGADAVQVAVGADHTVALRADGTVAAWGSNSDS
jgi:alpha-tubulin suppressor-like RCC1 family protein